MWLLEYIRRRIFYVSLLCQNVLWGIGIEIIRYINRHIMMGVNVFVNDPLCANTDHLLF